MSSAFHILLPKEPVSLVLDSPHSGAEYPPDFGYACSLNELRSAEDSYVDEIFGNAPDFGAALLCARFPRSYIDVNRAVDDIDPMILEKQWVGPVAPSLRSVAGHGLIRRLVRPGVPVYDRNLSQREILSRIDCCYHPYHAALFSLLEDASFRSGEVWHMNLHSMPSQPREKGVGPDIVLGDRDGTTCDPSFLFVVRDILVRMGYRVAINDPYRGVEILRRYGIPSAGRHSLQIEISKALYMDEKTLEKTNGFFRLKAHMSELVSLCADQARGRFLSMAAD